MKLLPFAVGLFLLGAPMDARADAETPDLSGYLSAGQYIVSPSNKYTAIFQNDGNFVIYRGGKEDLSEFGTTRRATWATNTASWAPATSMHVDFYTTQLCVGDSGTHCFGPKITHEKTCSYLVSLKDDGSIVQKSNCLGAGGCPACMGLAQVGTIVEPASFPNMSATAVPVGEDGPAGKTWLASNMFLTAGQYLVSPSRLYFAIMQTDGNFVVYKGSGPANNGGVLWATNTDGKGRFAIMQSDGNFCLYPGSYPANQAGTWCSMSNGGTGPYHLALQDDGRLSVFNGASPAAATGVRWSSPRWWWRMPGWAMDIGASSNGVLWIAGRAAMRWNSSTNNWDTTTANLSRLDVDGQGNVWGVNAINQIWRYDRATSTWKQLPGAGVDIGVNAAGDAWLIGMDSAAYHWNGTGWAGPYRPPGNATRIDVDSQRHPWVLNSAGGMYHWDGANWLQLPGNATSDIAVGGDDSVFVLNSSGQVFRWDNAKSTFVIREGTLTNLSVDGNGIPWGTNAAGDIYQGWK